MSSLRLAVPRARFLFHSQQIQALQHRATQSRSSLTHHRRNASTSGPPPPPKPRVLEQPDRFRPPSHGARLRNRPKYAGPPMSEHERQAQRTRNYPHMMPPEGSFAHWFLTDRKVHVFITLGILVSLVGGIYVQDFLTKTPYRELLPPGSLFFSHPVRYIQRWVEVFDMHIHYISATTAERRKTKVDDVVKRGEFRKAHGTDNEGWFGWTVRDDDVRPDGTREFPDDILKPHVLEERRRKKAAAAAEAAAQAEETQSAAQQQQPQGDTYVAFDGSVQPARKKYFGIF